MAAFDVSQEPAAKKNTIGENIGIIVSLYMYVEPPIRFLFSWRMKRTTSRTPLLANTGIPTK